MAQALIDKYNIPGPRYTSYPTVPFWDETQFSITQWKQQLSESFTVHNASEGISLYIHLPYCESMCTFCGCNKRITKQHRVEKPYIETVLNEWELYCDLLTERPRIKEIHLGGGTPTFFSPKHLEDLLRGILSKATIVSGHEFSFEGHPNNTTREHLETLYKLGFTRVSFGIQDYNPIVQKAINRIQTLEQVEKVTKLARAIGYTSVSHDIIFGLPFQTLEHVAHTITKTIALQPDRIAFYSYAHVPWIKGNGQRGYDESHLPRGKEKRAQYTEGKKLLEKHGYIEIGMDHFALKQDALYLAMKNNSLYRNFMGYTATKTNVMIGLGVSSIGDSWTGFSQNVKDISEYKSLLNNGEFPILRGHLLTEEDLVIRKHILNLMCQFKTTWSLPDFEVVDFRLVAESLKEMVEDGLVIVGSQSIIVKPQGKPFIRNICMALDLRLKRKQPESRLFSMTV